jgi:hypothetical protein
MRRTGRSTALGALLVAVLGLAAIAFLGGTLVLGLAGAQSAVTWTGTTGCVFLAAWLLAANGAMRRRGARRRQSAAHAVPRAKGEPLSSRP